MTMLAALLALLAIVNTTNSTVSYACDGTTAAFQVNYPYLSQNDLVVTSTTAGGTVTTLTRVTDWTVNVTSTQTTGTLTLLAPATKCPAGSTLKIARVVPLTQPINFDSRVETTAFDRLLMQVQQTNAVLTEIPATSITSGILPQPRGGTGSGVLNCGGSGFLTSDGTTFSCQVPSGLAPPGTTGVLLQAASPGSTQTGHINVTGTIIAGSSIKVGTASFVPNSLSLNSSAFSLQAASNSSSTISTNNVGAGAFTTSFTGWTAGATQAELFVSGNNGSNIGPRIRAQFLSTNPGIADATFGGTFAPCNAAATANFAYSTTKHAMRVCDGTTWQDMITSAPAAQQGAINVSGATVGTTGVASSGPVSGTTFTIGTSGTPITGSFRGTAIWNPGTIAAGAQATNTVTVTGAVTGADCIAGVVSPAPLSGYSVQCIITAANTCSLSILNQSAAGVTLGSATFYCRAFNP